MDDDGRGERKKALFENNAIFFAGVFIKKKYYVL